MNNIQVIHILLVLTKNHLYANIHYNRRKLIFNKNYDSNTHIKTLKRLKSSIFEYISNRPLRQRFLIITMRARVLRAKRSRTEVSEVIINPARWRGINNAVSEANKVIINPANWRGLIDNHQSIINMFSS